MQHQTLIDQRIELAGRTNNLKMNTGNFNYSDNEAIVENLQPNMTKDEVPRNETIEDPEMSEESK